MKYSWWARRTIPIIVAGCIALLGVGLLVEAEAVSEGIRRGLEVCAGVLIPSLFPFMALSGFLSLTRYAAVLSIPLRPITTRIYKLPGELGVVILLSMIGGYPVGARMIATLLEQGRIDQRTAERMLCFCVNSGPSFLITAVGIGLFLDKTVGVILFITQTAATLLIGWAVSLRVPKGEIPKSKPVYQKGAGAFVQAVSGACNAMIAMCAFAVLFSGVQSLVTASGLAGWLASWLPVEEALIQAVVGGIFEVTTGCIAAASLGGVRAFMLVSVFLSFSGLSVLFQVMSCFGGRRMRFGPLLLSRLCHAVLSTAMAVPLFQRFCKSSWMVWNSYSPPLMSSDSKTVLISVCLLAMCAIFTLSLNTPCKNSGVHKRK